MRRCTHSSYRSNAWAYGGAASEHRGLTGGRGHRGHECHLNAPAGFQPWLWPRGSLANVACRNLAVHALLLSVAASGDLPSPGHLVEVSLKNLKLFLVSDSGFLLNLLLQISNQQKCLQTDQF